jgi:hypothetical protein
VAFSFFCFLLFYFFFFFLCCTTQTTLQGGRPNHQGVDQKKKLETITRDLCINLGCELLLGRVTNHTDPMCKDMDQWLQGAKTFVDQFAIQNGIAATVFQDKVLASLQQVVAHAVAPASAEGIDVYGGVDFGVTTTLATTRMSARMVELMELRVDSENGEEGKEGKDEENEEEEDNEKTKAATALENLVAKLNGPEYDLVREAMGACTDGYLASYTAPGGGLAKASVMSLIRSGVTLEELREGGYPERVLLLFQQVATNMVTKSAAAAKASKK